MQFNEYQKGAMATKIYPEAFNIIYPALKLASEAGEVAGKVGKVIRDNNVIFDEERKIGIRKELGGVLWYIAAIAQDLGYNLDDIAAENLAILKSRQERGVLQGSGDDR